VPAARYGVTLVPVAPDDSSCSASIASGVVLASFTRSHHKEAALRLARFLSRPEHSFAMAAAVAGQLSSRCGADTLGAAGGSPRRRALLRQLAGAHFAPHVSHWSEAVQAIEEEVGAALAGRKTSREALTEAGVRIAMLTGKH
jgi:ABC-type glycerol-3-phosphate transport system substrate-binding protein